MNIRADVVELLHQGLNNVEIAERAGVHRYTVAKARHALGIPNVSRRKDTATERLYAEALPTGRVRTYDRRTQPITASQAAANRRALEEALRAPKPSRHLHVAPERTAA